MRALLQSVSVTGQTPGNPRKEMTMAKYRPMTRIDLHSLMGNGRVDLKEYGDNRVAYLKGPASREELLDAFKECGEQLRAFGEQMAQFSDVQEELRRAPLTPEEYDEEGFDCGDANLNDLSIYLHAYDRIHGEIYRLDKATEQAERAEKRRRAQIGLKVVA